MVKGGKGSYGCCGKYDSSGASFTAWIVG